MSTTGAAIMDVLYVVERDTAAFEAARNNIDVVCAGDSLTGWNNIGPVHYWPYPTSPQFLQELGVPLGLRVANGGMAGEISDNGPQHPLRREHALAPTVVPDLRLGDDAPVVWDAGRQRSAIDVQRRVRASLETEAVPPSMLNLKLIIHAILEDYAIRPESSVRFRSPGD